MIVAQRHKAVRIARRISSHIWLDKKKTNGPEERNENASFIFRAKIVKLPHFFQSAGGLYGPVFSCSLGVLV